jgi:hypothetical protein
MKAKRSSLDQAYLRWRGKFAPFEARGFETLCQFVRVHFDDLLDHYYSEGHQSLHDFPAWAFERYLQNLERKDEPQASLAFPGRKRSTTAHALPSRPLRPNIGSVRATSEAGSAKAFRSQDFGSSPV